ncbi:peptidoglycan-associated lipoprotein [Methylocaldum marinum]|uniref:Peptidoglycan-associated lipoprotein n=1 Tax=Methylocaldum marinum TaxID=1432792 RepID=A0A250L0A3_9GAMM|nr:peptidoglycan-associated lipoprotein Pal [Methylocaldum marinum]BBA37315.1 peptidoglycan-associated lipoprotein [Methylocaldum marinum]
MKLVKTGLVVAMMTLILSGCGSKGGVQQEAGPEAGMEGGPGGPEISKYGEDVDGGQYGTGYGTEYGTGTGYGTGDPMLDDLSSPLSKRVIYFMYDSYEVLPEYQQVVTAHANYLASHPERTVILEGHADERGSPEYNIALGEQRAKAIAKMMQFQGVNDGQVQVVSFGEEKPAVSGHDESAWQQNRRVEISYSGR